MKNLLILLNLVILCSSSESKKTNPIFTIENRIDFKQCGIQLSGMNEGITGFAVLDDNKIAIGYDSLIIIIDSNKNVIKRLIFNDYIGHFDLNSNGTGFVALGENLCNINKLVKDDTCFQPLFSTKGNIQGMFRMDILEKNYIRIVSLSPDFVVKGAIENIKTMRPVEQTFLDSCIIEKITEFIGFYKGKALFFSPNFNHETKKTFYDFVTFSVNGTQLGKEFSRVRIFDINFGEFMLLSYPCRYSGGDYFYIMMKMNEEILFIKVDLTRLVK